MLTANEALERLTEGNRRFLSAGTNRGDISPELRARTAAEGQHPYAVIVACSDSRVIPESIFSAGIGELFVIRVAGNVIGEHELGSIEYAVRHLGTRLVMVLGHTRCGAVAAAVEGHAEGFTAAIVRRIRDAIGDETNGYKACILNVDDGVGRIRRELFDNVDGAVEVVGAVYHTDDGRIELL